jgi:hypothetical protein
MLYKGFVFAALIISCFIPDMNESPGVVTNMQNPEVLPCQEKDVVHYTAHQITATLAIDGKLDEAAWKAATWSPRFVDLIKGTPTYLDTKAAVLWDEKYLYIGYWVEEPNVKATLTERDAPIYRDNDVEMFIAGPDGYYEFEINAYATIYEVLFFWEETFEKNGYSNLPEFDRTREGVKPFNGVGYKSHPRGRRIGFWNWDYPGLMKAVHVDGTINNDKDRDRGWTVELALPWTGFATWSGGRSLPPHNGDVWRMDFSRFNTYKEPAPAHDSGGWAMSPHGVWDSHVPECFTAVEFSKEPVGKPTK